MATYIVQLTSDAEPRPSYEVSQAEFERLLDLGLLVNEAPDPVAPDLFDQEMAQEIDDVNSQTRASLDARYVVGTGVREIMPLSQGAYDAIPTKSPTTLYAIIP